MSQRVAEALGNFYDMEELQQLADRSIAEWSGAPSGAITHCTAASITLAIASAMTGTDADKIAALPDTTDLPNRVVIPAPHVIDYGQSILQAIRLAGAIPVLVGTKDHWLLSELETQLSKPQTACLLLVSSRLVTSKAPTLESAVMAAHNAGLAAIIDGAAQDMRLAELLATNADLVLISAQKYLAAPTAGLVLGSIKLIQSIRANQNGIGRAMKPSKEALLGTLAAIEQREALDMASWCTAEKDKVEWFVGRANRIPGINATNLKDMTGLPLFRACLTIEFANKSLDARAIAKALKNSTPSIHVMGHALDEGKVILELIPLQSAEMHVILKRIAEICR